MSRILWSIFGQTGSGKTELWRYALHQLPAPRFVLDRGEELTDLGLTFESAEQLRLYLLAEAEGSVQRPPSGTYVLEYVSVKTGSEVLRMAREARIPGVYIVDEAHHWYGQQSQDEYLHDMLMEGRSDGQSVITTSRRPQNVGKNLLNESAITSFRQQDPHARKRVASYFLGAIGPDDLGSLGTHEYVTGGRLEVLDVDIGQEARSDEVHVNKLTSDLGDVERVKTIGFA